jgi:hypothetical protein
MNRAHETQEVTKPMSAARMIDHTPLDEVLAGE